MKRASVLLILIFSATLFSADTLMAQGWFAQTSGVSNTLEGVFFTSTDSGMAVGSSGAMLRTTNGGATWTTQSSGTTQTLHWISFRNASVGSVVGDNGVIRRTTDGGASWIAQTSGTTNALYEIFYVSDTRGFAVGANGRILRTTNAGTTWTSQTSGTSQTLYGVTFTDSLTGTAVGANGTIRRTTNGGSSWTSQSSGTSNILFQVSFINATTGLAVGANGTIIRTTNGGTTWTSQTSGTTQTLLGERFVNSTTGFVVGTGGVILRTTDGGISWAPQTSGSSAILFEVHFTDPNTGTTVGSSGTILRTTTGGESGSGPLFSVSPSSVAFGNAVIGSNKQDSVTVTNTGTSTLNISSVSSDNGEFTVSPPSGSLAPSASQKFYITFSPANSGAESGNIMFVHNAATSPDSVSVSGAGVEPGFLVVPSSVAFGNVVVGSSKQDSVTVTNTGTSTLNISSASSDNGEFTVLPPSGSLAPSASQKFYITFSPTNSGSESGNVIFVHDASTSPDSVSVSGDGVESGFSVAPGSVAFGNVIVGSSKQDSVTVTNSGTSTLNISSTSSDNGEFTVSPPTGSLAPSASQKFYITFSPTNAGAESGSIIFVHDASTSPDTVSVSGAGVEPVFAVAPGSLAFGNVVVGSNKEDSVTVTNTGTWTLNILSVNSDNGEFTVSPPVASIPPLSSQKFYITFSPTNSGSESGNVIFVHDASTSPDSVSVSGAGVESGFSVAPGSIAFGNVVVGSNKQDSVTVTNTGTSTLNVSSASSDNGEFAVSPPSGSIAPLASQKFYITFSPTNSGSESGNIIFVHDASTSPDSVSVSGTGVESGFAVAPGSIAFGNVVVGSSKQDSVTVTNTGTLTLNISSASSDNGEFTVSPPSGSIAPSNSQKFYITFSPTNSGSESGNVIFTHDASTSPDSVSVSGAGVESGFSVAPGSIAFGNVVVGSSKQDSVTVTNTGTSTLNISSASSDNGEFVVSPPSGSIAPSNSQKFYITFSPTNSGSESGNIIFVHDASTSPDSVSVSGTGVESGFAVAPGSIAFGNVVVGSSKQDSVTVTNTGTSTLNISSVSSTNGEFTVSPPSGSIAPLASQKFYTTFSPTNSGSGSGNVIFVHDASTSPDSVSVSGAGVESGFSVAPGSVAFGNVVVGSNKQDSVTVTNTGTSTLNISSASSDNGEFTVSPPSGSIASLGSQKFYITFSPTNAGAESGNIIFVHDASTSPDSVSVSGTGVESGFSVAPGSIAFGNVVVGLSKQDSVTVTNTGTSTLNISSASSDNGEFTVSPPSGSIAPLASQKFYITFSPTNSGSESGSIIFTHDASTSPDSVSVSGTGVEAGFAVAPGSVAFGNVSVGSSKQDSVTVTNTGTSTLNISAVNSDNPMFNVTPGNGSLPPGTTKKFYLVFSPVIRSGEAGHIIFDHDASGSPDTVSVTGTGITPPVVITNPATNVLHASATLNGTVDPQFLSAMSHFEWGTSTAYGNLTPLTPVSMATPPVPITFALSGLTPGTQYHFRGVATNEDGSGYGNDQTFTTLAGGSPDPPVLVAPLNGSVEQAMQQTFRWRVAATATNYRLQVSTSAAFVSTVVDDSTLVDTTKLVVLSPTTTYYWRVRGKNIFGIGGYSSVWSFTTGALPVVVTEPATHITLGSARMNGTITPNASLANARFEWGTTTSYGNLTPITPVSFASVPIPVLFTLGGLTPNTIYHYRLRGENGAGTVLGQDVQFSTAVQVSVPLFNEWEMISNPVTTANDSVRQLFPTSSFEFAYGSIGSYVQVYRLENGMGYWEKFAILTPNPITGLPRTLDTVDVPEGWSMLGSLSSPLDTSDITSIPPGLRASNWIGYGGVYTIATQIIPGKGYWVKAASAGKFVFAAPTVAQPAKPNSSGPDPLAGLSTLTISDSRGGVQTLYFGFDAGNDVPLSLYDMPPSPPEGAYDVRFETREGGSMVRTHAGNFIDEKFPVRIQANAYPLTVTWSVKGTASYTLLDGTGTDGFTPKELRGDGTLTISSAEVNRLIIQLMGDGQTPREFALSQNYPNPFNPTTNVKYALPVDSRVTMEIYNVLGQRVRALMSDNLPAGYHLAEWDGKNNSGQQLSSGMYFLQLSASGINGKTFNEVRKLIMLK